MRNAIQIKITDLKDILIFFTAFNKKQKDFREQGESIHSEGIGWKNFNPLDNVLYFNKDIIQHARKTELNIKNIIDKSNRKRRVKIEY